MTAPYRAESPGLRLYTTAADGTATLVADLKCDLKAIADNVSADEIAAGTYCTPNRKFYKVAKHDIAATALLSFTDPDDATQIGFWNKLRPHENKELSFVFQTDDRKAFSPSFPGARGTTVIPPIPMINSSAVDGDINEVSVTFAAGTWDVLTTGVPADGPGSELVFA